MEKSVLQRIRALLKTKRVSMLQVSDSCGIKQNTFSRQISGESSLSASTLLSIIGYFEDVSTEWLLRGSGEMLKDTQSSPSSANSDTEPKLSTTSAMYETLIKDRDEQIEELKAEVNKLIGENNVMREQLGMKERKISSKSA